MMFWVQSYRPEYWDRTLPNPRRDKVHLRPDDICGTYELLATDAAILKCQERSEIVISNDGDSLYGRFRIGRDVHGLFRSNRVPTLASTEPVQCHMVIEDYDRKDGSWWFEPGAEIDHTEGITFLGNGLIKLSPSLFTFREHKIFGNVLFGIKTSEYQEEVTDLKDAWCALHRHSCDCKGDHTKH